MFTKPSTFISLVFAIVAAAAPVTLIDRAPPPSHLPISVKYNVTHRKLPDIDRARAMHLLSVWTDNEHGEADDSSKLELSIQKRAGSLSASNTGVGYVANVGIGSPATSYSLLIDTGSSNTWVDAKKFAHTGSSKDIERTFNVEYGSGHAIGNEFTDKLTLSPDLSIEDQAFGVASEVVGFPGIDGVLGLGPVHLTAETVKGENTVPTVADNLFKQKKISTELFSLSFNPSIKKSPANGEITFGGTDSSKFTGAITYAPLTKNGPSSEFWGLDESVSYGVAGNEILSSKAGIIDSGSSLILIASDAFERYKTLTGAELDSETGMLMIDPTKFKLLQSVFFKIGDSQFELTPNAQIWPREMNRLIGGAPDGIYLVIADLGMKSGQGFDFVQGFAFLQRFYTVFDTTNKRIGVATTENTKATTN